MGRFAIFQFYHRSVQVIKQDNRYSPIQGCSLTKWEQQKLIFVKLKPKHQHFFIFKTLLCSTTDLRASTGFTSFQIANIKVGTFIQRNIFDQLLSVSLQTPFPPIKPSYQTYSQQPMQFTMPGNLAEKKRHGGLSPMLMSCH